jgi:hypothetical protein
MSQENVELVRFLDAFNARDINVLVSLSAEDCEWRPFRAQLEGIVYRGHEASGSSSATWTRTGRRSALTRSSFTTAASGLR